MENTKTNKGKMWFWFLISVIAFVFFYSNCFGMFPGLTYATTMVLPFNVTLLAKALDLI